MVIQYLCGLFFVVVAMVAAFDLAPSTSAPSQTDSQLVRSFVNWQPTPGTYDEQNPYRKSIISKGEAAIPLLLNSDGRQGLPTSVIWVLGEIGSRRAFPALVAEYLHKPSPRTGVSLGSCLGLAEVNYLFDSGLLSDPDLRELMSIICGPTWPQVSVKTTSELKTYLISNVLAISGRCKIRSQPVAG